MMLQLLFGLLTGSLITMWAIELIQKGASVYNIFMLSIPVALLVLHIISVRSKK